MRKLVPLAALAAATFAAAPAQAANGDCWEVMTADDPPVGTGVFSCQQQNWFHAPGGAKVTNGNGVPSWNATAPAGAWPQAGSVYAALRPIDMLESSSDVRPTFTGTYKGTLENIAVTAYASSLYTALGGANALYTRLTIDGEVAWENLASADAEIEVPQVPVDDTTSVMRFAWTNLAATLKRLKVANGADAEHTITLEFINKYWGDSNFVLRYDAAEYPAGVTFNLQPDPVFGLADYTQIYTDV